MSRFFTRLAMSAAAGAAVRAGSLAAGVAAGYAVRGLGAATTFVVGAFAGATTSVVGREFGYASEWQATNHLPDPANTLSAYWGGWVTLDEAEATLNRHGIPFGNRHPPGANYWGDVWRKVIAAQRPTIDVSSTIELWRQAQITPAQCRERLLRHGLSYPRDPARGKSDIELLMYDEGHYDLGTATDLWRQGLLTDPMFEDALWRAGIGNTPARHLLMTQGTVAPLAAWESWWLAGWVTDADYRARLSREGVSSPADHERFLRMRTPPPIAQVIADYWLQSVPLDETRRRMQLHGYGTDQEIGAITQAQAPYSPAEALRLFWRGSVTWEDLGNHLGAAGIVGDQRQGKWLAAARPIPDPATLISFAVHEAWDNDVVRAFGYDAEFPPTFGFWMHQQGWDWGADVAIPGAPPGAGANWPQLFWRSHWRIMSPTQGYRAFHRLRPDRIARYQDRVPGLEPFVWADLERVLRIADYPPKLRRWLAASAFAVLPIYVVRSLYRLGKRQRPWLIDQLRDRGFSLDDAEAMADNEDAAGAARQAAAKQRRQDKLQREAITLLLDAYAEGTFTRDQVIENLQRYFVDETEAKALIDLRAAKENLATVRAAVSRIRRGFLAGEFSPAELPGQLTAAGVVPEMVSRYISRWTLARSHERRQLSTERIVKYVAEGRLSLPIGLSRLANLGWQNPDALLLTEKARHDADELEAKHGDSERLPKSKRQRELEAVASRCTRLAARVQSDLRRMTPLSALKQWLLDHIVSVRWARERMLLMGYTDEVVSHYIESWGIAEEKALATEKNGVAPTTSEATPPAAETTAAPALSSGVIPPGSQGPKLVGGGRTIGQTDTQPTVP